MPSQIRLENSHECRGSLLRAKLACFVFCLFIFVASGHSQTGNPPTLSSVTVSPSSVIGGIGSTGIVTLTGVAPAAGVVVTLSSSNPTAAPVPASVTVSAGWKTRVFGVTTFGVAATQSATITASSGGIDAQATLTVNAPTLSSFTLNSTSVQGGTTSTGTVALTGVAPAAGTVVTLSSSNPPVATFPASVTVSGALKTKAFWVTTFAVATAQTVTLTAAYGGASQQATLTVNPPAVSSLTFNPSSVQGGTASTGTVTLTGVAPAGGAAVTLASSDTAVATVPASVVVGGGATAKTFSVTTFAVGSAQSVSITASYGGVDPSATLVVNPVNLTSLTVSPASVIGGMGSTGTVTLSGVAPAGGVVVTLASSNPAAATVPASVTVSPGWKTRVFGVTTDGVAANQPVTITASCNGVDQEATLNVNAPTLNSFTLSPIKVTGGTATAGTVALTGVAPAGGEVVTLTSSNTAAATVPASVTVSGGAKTKAFLVTTSPVSAVQSVALTASYGGANQQAILTVDPVGAAGTLSPTCVNFGNYPIDMTGGPENLSLTNSGYVPLTLTNIAFTGADPGDFVENNTCGSLVEVGAQCTISVAFTPSASGTRTAVLSISDDAGNSLQTVSLSGIGSHDVVLYWAASASPSIVGYNVYRGTTPGGENSTPLNSAPIDGITYTDDNVTAGATYFYVVTSVSPGGATSAGSNETAATIPLP